MIVTALGHAGLMVETQNATLLLDPWFSPTGAFQASWFQYPDNSHLLKLEKIYNPTAVIISHEHLDHVDPWFLAKLPPDVPVIIPRYPSMVLQKKVLLGGPRPIVEVDEWQSFEIAPGTNVFFVKEPPMNHDSAIVVTGDGYSLLNMNDARLFPMQMRDIKQKVGGKIDMLTFQGAGASWFPMCYNFSSEKAKKVSEQKRITKFMYCLKTMNTVKPVVGLPLAGPPAFLDPELFIYNDEMETGIYPDQQQVADWLMKKNVLNTVVLLPNEAWDMEKCEKIADPEWEGFSFDNRKQYLKDYQQRKLADIEEYMKNYPEPEASLYDDFVTYFSGLQLMSGYFNERIGMRVGFDVTGAGGGQWFVDFKSDSKEIGSGLEGCGYVYQFQSRWLPSLLNGSVPFEDFFLSLRFRASRDPDIYNDHLLGLLKFAEKEALDEVEKFETTPMSDERITVHAEGKTYSVSRYCPHAGNDLLNSGEVLPGGIFRCLAHNYDFDLNTGMCLTGNCDAIKVNCISIEPPEKTAQ